MPLIAIGAALATAVPLAVAPPGASAAESPRSTAAAIRPAAEDIEASDLAWAARHSRGGIPWALAEAARTGRKTLVPDETTPTSLTYANPDGTLTSEVTTGPERMQRDGKWIDVDATLTETGGMVAAKAHPEGLRLAPGGGTRAKSLQAANDAAGRDLVTLGTGAEQVTMQWKGGLPKPVLEGTRATYKDAVPGADVIVEATRTGFEQFVRLDSAPAAGAYTYTLPLKAKGLKAAAQKDGSVRFTDARTGAPKATMPAPVMWDASVDKISGRHENRARVGMEVVDNGGGNIDLVVTPDAEFLADPATEYPVTVDPSTSALGNTFDTYVQQGETTDLGSETELDFGNPGTVNADGTPRTARTLMTWNTAPFADALVSSASVQLYNFHSGATDCKAQGWTVWNTGAGSSASRWTKQPEWMQQYATGTQTAGYPAGCPSTADGWIKADVTELAKVWASGKQTAGHMGVRAVSDDTKAWKRVNSRNATANQPKLTVNYNFRPGDGSAQQAGAPFKSYAGVWAVNSTTPTLRDKFADADGDKVNGTFQVYDAATNKPITTPAGDGAIVSDYVAPGSWASVKVPAGQLKDGRTYKFRTNAYDGTHYNLGWSPWREFAVDTIAPGEPAAIGSATYPDDGRGGGTGVQGTFDVDTGDDGAQQIRYRVDGELPEDDDPGLLDGTDESPDAEGGDSPRPPTRPTARAVAPEWQSAPTTGTTGSFTATPGADGAHHVEVQTVDRADNVGATGTYGFLAGGQVRTNHVVDITLPDKPAYSDGKWKATGEWQQIPGWATAALRSTAPKCTDRGDGTVSCGVLKPRTSKGGPATEPSVVTERLDAAPVAPRAGTELLPECSGVNPDGTPNPDNAQWGWFNRTKMCMAAYYEYYTYDKKTKKRLTQADFFIDVQIKTDTKSPDIKFWSRIRPKTAPPPTPAMKNDIEIGFTPRCDFGCTGVPAFTWDGSTTWKGAKEYDSHEVTGTATMTYDVKNDQNGGANGSGWDGKSRKDNARSRTMPISFFGPDFNGAAADEDSDVGVSGDSIFEAEARCDFADIGMPPGCVFPDYVPGYVIKGNEFPAAAAHIWLITGKIGQRTGTYPGSWPSSPLHYLPMTAKAEHKANQRNAYDRGANANRNKICGRSGANGFEPHGLTRKAVKQYNHPKRDTPSCDEFSFNSTYESAGMPANMVPSGITSYAVDNGAQCVQTYEGLADDGKIHLRDDGRYPEPDWKNINCGRSSMALSVNSGSMAPFGAFAKAHRMLDQDAYYVYAPMADLGCGEAIKKDVVTCEITDLDPDTIP
ncbi:DNRLRE domain-containing protein [Streptomyces sp. NBC_01257]|uniref:DNRLRE domain-containing protein n=1 Tax=Streptomyces sp. NBC_01257 TaxID=2903799 RepID=UPI002DDAC042|nr:DNRLRE domain-containing protein [Streptomyces sp. NBC_01257]WRZ66424.1 DNRLRE domain-containing protein [Streptomyces sp. NBC_01257]